MKLIVAEKAVQLTAYFFACVSFNSCFLHRSFLNLTVKNTKNWSTFAEDIEKINGLLFPRHWVHGLFASAFWREAAYLGQRFDVLRVKRGRMLKLNILIPSGWSLCDSASFERQNPSTGLNSAQASEK